MSSPKKATFSALEADVKNISDNDISADASSKDDGADYADADEIELSLPSPKLARGKKYKWSQSLTMNRSTIILGSPLGKTELEQARVKIDIQEPPSKLASTVQARRE